MLKELIEEKFTPKDIVRQLDNHIIGQDAAKKQVAIALRNRIRRMKVNEELRQEITPKNILMIGPTGVGKTEMARRLAKLTDAPFTKIEATKFTEVGYVGRDVESIIRDLVENSIKKTREKAIKSYENQASLAAEERILDTLLPDGSSGNNEDVASTRQLFRKKLREGDLDERDIEIDVQANSPMGVEIMAPPGMEEMTNQLQGLFQNLSKGKTKTVKMKVKDALKTVTEEEAAKLINEDDIKSRSLNAVEQSGIVFIDEIDKITQRSERNGGDVSREGVQRDLLPLIEGATVTTKYGPVKTDHILFIASGAFHLSKPSDLIPELQGRLPIRVEFNALMPKDFERILSEPKASLIAQYVALLETENVKIDFTLDGIERIAALAWNANEKTENIGARRLHTIMEKLLEEISYNVEEYVDKTFKIDSKYVDQQIAGLVEDEDLSRFIL